MQKRLQKVLAQIINETFTRSFPSFNPCGTELYTEPGLLYMKVEPSITFYIFFEFSEKRDAFTVELAWSRDGTFPALSDGLPRDWMDIGVLRKDQGARSFRFRLAKLWVKPKYDPWWELVERNGNSISASLSIVAEPSLTDSEKCVQLTDDAVRRIGDFGCPYMNETRAWVNAAAGNIPDRAG